MPFKLKPKKFVINQGKMGIKANDTVVHFENQGTEIIMTMKFTFTPTAINISSKTKNVPDEILTPNPITVDLPTDASQNQIPDFTTIKDFTIELVGERTAKISSNSGLIFESDSVKDKNIDFFIIN